MVPMVALRRVALVLGGQAPPSELVTDLVDGMPFLQGNAEFGETNPVPRLQCASPPKECASDDALISVRAPVGALNVADRTYGIGRGLAAVRATDGDSRYLWYSIASSIPSLRSRATGTTFEGVSADQIKTLEVPRASTKDQRRIADFLDDRIARIDETIRLRKEQENALRERIDSVWTARAASLMAKSDVIPIRRVLSSIIDGPFGSSLTSAHYSERGTRVVRLGNLGRAAYRYGDEAFIPSDYGRVLSSHSVCPGDLLIAGLGDETWPLGRATVAPGDLGDTIVKADCYRARLVENQNAEFFAWFLSSPVAAREFMLLSRGSTRARLNTSVVREVHVPLVGLAQQRLVVDEFREERRATDAAISEMEGQVDLLSEYKRSLITAAVSGEFDVSSASGRDLESV